MQITISQPLPIEFAKLKNMKMIIIMFLLICKWPDCATPSTRIISVKLPYHSTSCCLLSSGSSYADITLDLIKLPGAAIQTSKESLNKTSLGNVPEAGYMVVAIPKDLGLIAMKDDGFGGQMAFDEDVFGANGIEVDFEGVPYLIYGELALVSGERFIYVV